MVDVASAHTSENPPKAGKQTIMYDINIVLHEPEIPQNTGNISRTCAATHSSLHLIRPLGFSVDDRSLRRAGLDYWMYLDVHYYDSLEDFFEKNPDAKERSYYFSTKAPIDPYFSIIRAFSFCLSIFASFLLGFGFPNFTTHYSKRFEIVNTLLKLFFTFPNLCAIIVVKEVRDEKCVH